MDIKPLPITIRELIKGYEDKQDEGVVGYGGKLDIRPPYQREFVYEGENRYKRDKVIETLLADHPLGIMYWVDIGNGRYEVLDGQQRIISICQYIAEESFGLNGVEFDSQPEDKQEAMLDYNKMVVYVCRGKPSEKIAWFETINIAGLTLTTQEMNNAVFHGKWVSDAKRYFSKERSQAKNIGENYIPKNGQNFSHRRQHLLELAIKWHIIGMKNKDGDPMTVRDYMSANKNKTADELWRHYNKIIDWADKMFPVTREELTRGLNWGKFYAEHRYKKDLNPDKLEKRIVEILKDEDDAIKNKRGVYEYVLTGNKQTLKLRKFNTQERRTLYERQGRKCANHRSSRCPTKGKEIPLKDMDADHIEPWVEGGETRLDNAQMLCRKCNQRKGDR